MRQVKQAGEQGEEMDRLQHNRADCEVKVSSLAFSNFTVTAEDPP